MCAAGATTDHLDGDARIIPSGVAGDGLRRAWARRDDRLRQDELLGDVLLVPAACQQIPAIFVPVLCSATIEADRYVMVEQPRPRDRLPELPTTTPVDVP